VFGGIMIMKKLAKRKVSKIKQKPAKQKSVRQRNPIPSEKEIEEAVEDLLWPHDGPVTYWIVLSRAMELSAERKYSPEILSGAVYEIVDCKWDKLLSTSNS